MSFAAPPMRTLSKMRRRRMSGPTGHAPSVGPLLLVLVLIAAAMPLSCGKKRTIAGPPVSAPAPRQPNASSSGRSEAPLSAPQTVVQLPPAQEVPKGAAPARPSFPSQARPAPTAPARQPAPQQPAPPPATASSRPETPTPTEPSTASDLPQLSPLMSPEKRRALEGELDRRLARTRADLQRLMGRTLNGEQVAAVKRIQAFVNQAEDTRDQDLNLARNLAQRAEVLAADLVRSAL